MRKLFFITLALLLFIPLSIQAKEVIVNNVENGTITVDKKEAEEGETVTITVTPNEGYELKSIKAVDKFDEMPVTITDNSFVMPSYNVFISAEFEKVEDYVEPDDVMTYGTSQADETPSKNNTLIYVIGGVGVLLVGALVLLVSKNKK